MIDFEVGSGGVVTASSSPVHKPFGGNSKVNKSVDAVAPEGVPGEGQCVDVLEKLAKVVLEQLVRKIGCRGTWSMIEKEPCPSLQKGGNRTPVDAAIALCGTDCTTVGVNVTRGDCR